ncbi:hypothetical protein [Paenibacillus tundrae]|uniref:hypothetical protein n=1 Tax=Paenibacillus tundrae TaxID=528187 RepID=UPI0030D4014E
MYNKQEWKDEIPDLTKPIMDSSTGKQKTDRQTGRPLFELVQEGTRITSSRLNTMEDGIEAAHGLVEILIKEMGGNFVATSNGIRGLACTTQGLKVTWTAGVAYVNGLRYEVAAGEIDLAPTKGQYVYVDTDGVVKVATNVKVVHKGLVIFYASTDTSGVISSEDRRVNLNMEELRKRIESVENDIITKTNTAERNAKTYTDERVGVLTDLKTNAKGNAVLAINELFQSVSNGKELLANAITDMGQPTLATDSYEVMSEHIGMLTTNTFMKEFGITTAGYDLPTTLTQVMKVSFRYVGLLNSFAPYILYSNNGYLWTPATITVPEGVLLNSARQMAYGSDLFIVLANGKNLLRSGNGVDWELVTQPTSSATSWTNIVYAGGMFCVTDGKSTMLSVNGYTWTVYENSVAALNTGGNIPNNLTGGESSHAKFIMSYPADVNSTNIIYSNDGVAWNHIVTSSGLLPPVVGAFTFGSRGWVALGVEGVATSVDGALWEVTTFTGSQINSVPSGCLAYFGGQYVVAGQSRNASNFTRAAIFTSRDGNVWERVWMSADNFTLSSFRSLAYDEESAIFYSTTTLLTVYTGKVNPGSIFDDARVRERNFRTSLAQAIFKQTVGTSTVAAPELMLENIARIPRNVAATDWVNRQTIAPAVLVKAVCMVKASFVGVTQLASGATSGNAIRSQNGGTSFATVSTPKVDAVDIAHNNAGMIVAVGQASSGVVASAMYSTNVGLSWTAVSTAQLSASLDFGIIQWTGTKFIAITRSAAVYSSTDGTTWSSEPVWMGLRTGTIIDSVITPQGMYIMTNYNILYTADYVTYETILTCNNSCLSALAYGNGVLVVTTTAVTVINRPDGTQDMSKRGEVLTSTDGGVTWQFNILGSNNAGWGGGSAKQFTDVTFNRGLFVATLNSSSSPNIAVSHDGVNWIGRSKASGASATNYSRVTGFGGVFIAFPGGSANSTWMTSGTIDQELYNAGRGY